MRIRYCGTCFFAPIKEVTAPYGNPSFLCVRFPEIVSRPDNEIAWCGEWKPDKEKVCGLKPDSKSYYLCLKAKNHDGKCGDGIMEWEREKDA